MKKKYILSFLFLLLIICLCIYLSFNKEEEVIEDNDCLLISDNLSYEYYDEVLLSSIVDSNCNLVKDDYIDTYSLGNKSIEINYINKKNQNNHITFNYQVVDTTKPIILGSSSFSTYVGEEIDFLSSGICADNYDKKPNCFVEGDYDISSVGTYDLKYYAIDSSNNETVKDIKLYIKEKPTSSSSSTNTSKKSSIDVSDIISKHKNENTMIGIDVSSWQDKVDYEKVKASGIEFVIIRIGFGHKDGEIIEDSWYKENIKNAKSVGLKVGLYFYSYAKSTTESIEQANWIIKMLNNEKLDLPIAFDFESFSKWNSYNISLTDINQTAKKFMDTLINNGYDAMLYGSKYYLENIWDLDKYDTWLAHYTSETTYEGNYYIWQLTNRGKVDGISGNVDINVLYTNKKVID